jgi:hypothetical protein
LKLQNLFGEFFRILACAERDDVKFAGEMFDDFQRIAAD